MADHRIRRKVRKGTFSCQECKRRKRRCEFPPDQSRCLLCQRLKLHCVNQNTDDETTEQPQDRRRIDQLESLVTQILVRQVPDQHHNLCTGNPSAFGAALSDHLSSLLPTHDTMNTIRAQGSSPFDEYWRSKTELTFESKRHPAYFARTFLELALCLNRVKPQSDHHIVLSRPARDTARRYVEIAKHITAQDHLVQSIMGLETLLLQGCYNAQSYRAHAAWLTFQRAYSNGQLMQKHPTSNSVGANNLWFRIVSSDRFASLLLGLPCASSDCIFIDHPTEHTPVVERVERVHIEVAGQIIARNINASSKLHGLIYDTDSELHCIESNLKQAAKYFPHAWWGTSSLMGELSLPAVHLGTQIHHFHLILLAHLPHILQALKYEPMTGLALSPSIVMGLSSSRDLISRIQLARQLAQSPGTMCGMKHKAYLAAVILLLIHIGAHKLGSVNIFEHQRPCDIFLAEKTAEALEIDGGLYDEEKGLCIDVVGLRKLHDAEAHAADGVPYKIMASADPGGDHADVRVELPYFGTLSVVCNAQITALSDFHALTYSDVDVLEAVETTFNRYAHPG